MTDTSKLGHGHVIGRPDGAKNRCGGPGMCWKCAEEAESVIARLRASEAEDDERYRKILEDGG